MRSIRLSLTVYFLALLAAALGGASWFAYRTAHKTLLAKQLSAAEQLEAQYQERCREEEARLDQALLYQAQTLARLAQFQFDVRRMRAMNQMGLLRSRIMTS